MKRIFLDVSQVDCRFVHVLLSAPSSVGHPFRQMRRQTGEQTLENASHAEFGGMRAIFVSAALGQHDRRQRNHRALSVSQHLV